MLPPFPSGHKSVSSPPPALPAAVADLFPRPRSPRNFAHISSLPALALCCLAARKNAPGYSSGYLFLLGSFHLLRSNLADTVGRLHEDAVRLLYHAAIVKASGNVDNGVLIAESGVSGRIIVSASVGRPCSGANKPNWDSFSPPSARSTAAAPPQALLLRHSKIAAVVRGKWSP